MCIYTISLFSNSHFNRSRYSYIFPTSTSVNALVNDVQYFTICDNYLRGFELVERAHAAAKDVDAADLLSKAAMRLRQARAQQYVVVW